MKKRMFDRKSYFLTITSLGLILATILVSINSFAEEKGINSQGTTGFFGIYEEEHSPDPGGDNDPNLKNEEELTNKLSNQANTSNSQVLPNTGEKTNEFTLIGWIMILTITFCLIFLKKRKENAYEN
ncbi:TPA: LPXTG cell wall anchor domain-containing protein [Enterococcus faecalis]|nr:LPXTG cell wall anchor domain-containing protein [Enterococcus faecalis]HDH7717960.1 LPXTG cell wall anchor domain-containing protein [Enterococcus faecalis]HDH7720535.1 LPXTG cell wall anchor domain-containing protein [Enterococcus faecalis]HDH7723661.1 LPXTG cell wall anchor domain-containing protein [Enterococcus faecalis]